MKYVISDREIEAYAYRDRSDIEELVLTDEVETVKEGAFYHCTNLRRIVVGHNVSEVQMSAFEGVPKDGDLVWLAKISYKPLVYRVFQSVAAFASVCAPHLPFFNGMLYERTALAAGFILHPEYEDEYGPELKEEYVDYIRKGLESDIKRFSDAGILIDIIKNITERKLVNKKRTLEMLVSYARACVTTEKDKRFLDALVERENLSNKQDRENNFEDREKKQLRFVYFNTNRSEQEYFLKNGDIPADLPEVRYKDGTVAPPDLLRFIMFRYMNQWAFVVRPVPEFEYDENADKLAAELDIDSLRNALSQMMPEVVPKEEMKHPDMNKSEFGVIHIQRLIPYLRYATQEMADDCARRSERFLDYDKYGLSGHKTYRTYQSALLLCEGGNVPLEVLRWGRLPAYAYLKKTDIQHVICLVEECIVRLENEDGAGMDLSKEREMIKKEVTDLIYDLYVSGSTMKYSDLRWLCAKSTFFRNICGGLLWKNTENNEYFTMFTGEDETGIVSEGSYVTPAHTCEMEREDISFWKNRTDPVFPQLWDSPEVYSVDNPERWTGKYKGIKTSQKELKSLVRRGFQLWANNDNGYSIYFYGRCYIHGNADTNGEITLDTISEASFRPRELNEALHAIDELLFDRLVGYGKVPAEFYIDRFDAGLTDRIIDMALDHKAYENVAVLLEHKKKFLKGNSDLDL